LKNSKQSVALIFRENTSNIGILPLPLLPRAPDKSEIIPFVLNTIPEGQEEPFTLIFVAFRGKEGRKGGGGGVLWGFYSCFKKEN
jgi:hypothetical protein